MNHQLYVYDCLLKKLRVSDGYFMTIGKGENNTFRVAMQAENGGSFAQRDAICRFFPHGKIQDYSLNGTRLKTDSIIHPETFYLMVISGACLVFWYGEEAKRPDFSNYNPDVWYLHDKSTGKWRGPLALLELEKASHGMPMDALATFQGLNNSAFYLSDALEVAAFLATQPKEEAVTETQLENTLYRCPSCWKEFNCGSALAVATHPDLCGDDLVGEDEQLRFTPEKYSNQGLPIDSKGSPCVEYACPLCHHKLPPFFGNTKQHIFSLVGVPAAGKTYYLASLVHEMTREMPRDFNIPFRDSSPARNASLNDMSLRLFSAQTPQEAYLDKTRLEGNLYQRVWRHGHFSNMPRPFIYNLNKGPETYSIVVYDNAGENYEPSSTGEDNPAAEHLSISSSILYLFDPTTNPGFRGLLQGNSDPQLKRNLYPPGRQGLLLAETEMRLRTRLNVPPGQKIDIPFALIIGKCDTWQHLLGAEPLLPVVRNGMYLPENVNANSARLRKFLFNISPYICTNAEAISQNVRYFASSSFGSSPVEFTDEMTGSTLIAPDTAELQPLRVIDPMLWALSCAEPSLLPRSQK